MTARQTDRCTHTLYVVQFMFPKLFGPVHYLAATLAEHFFGDCERQNSKSDFPGTLSGIVPFSRVSGTATLEKMGLLYSAKKEVQAACNKHGTFKSMLFSLDVEQESGGLKQITGSQ